MQDLDNNFINNNNSFVYIPRSEIFVQTKASFLRNKKYTAYQKTLYQILHSYGIDYRGVYPSHQRLAEELAVSRRMIIKVLNQLEEFGGVYIINRVFEGTKNKSSNLYYLSEIDKSGDFDKESLDIVKIRYPNKTVEIKKSY